MGDGSTHVGYGPLPIRNGGCEVERRPDGSILLRSKLAMPQAARSLPHLFAERAREHPDRTFLAKRAPEPGGGWGDWRRISYGEARRGVRPGPSRRV
jgi:feruloyl-CoA synthase